MVKISINTKQIDRLIDDMEDLSKDTLQEGYKTFKEETPVKKGNAKRRTVLTAGKIRANYSYAGRLDEGWSKQSPKGMSNPAIDEMKKFVDTFIKRVG